MNTNYRLIKLINKADNCTDRNKKKKKIKKKKKNTR